jgi:hypothetical protein
MVKLIALGFVCVLLGTVLGHGHDDDGYDHEHEECCKVATVTTTAIATATPTVHALGCYDLSEGASSVVAKADAENDAHLVAQGISYQKTNTLTDPDIYGYTPDECYNFCASAPNARFAYVCLSFSQTDNTRANFYCNCRTVLPPVLAANAAADCTTLTIRGQSVIYGGGPSGNGNAPNAGNPIEDSHGDTGYEECYQITF